MANLQAKLLDHLKNRLDPHISLTKWLVETLKVEYSVAYRKVSGDSRLQLEEFVKVIQACPAVLSNLLSEYVSNDLFIGHYRFYRNEAELNTYLKSVLHTFHQAEKKQLALKYFCREWPFLLFLKSETVLDYKLSMWFNTLKTKGLSAHSKETHRLAQEIVAVYEGLPSEEIWHRELFSNQWLQLQWNAQCKVLCTTEVDTIMEEMQGIVAEVQRWCENGEKANGTFDLMVSSFSTLTTNCGLLGGAQGGTLLSAVNEVAHLTTEAPSLIANFEEQFETHKSCSVSIAQVNTLARAEFFNDLYQLFEVHENEV